ncbi:MAG TPA: hypothetical protein VMF86_09395 [Stellaceae bacterium]|nr:hypothetical protein [Stellaceae bacterium]
MPEIQSFVPGGYRFLVHQFQYSGGVAALPGFRIERARFARPLPLAEGFAAAEAHLARLGRPQAAFCACELRSPRQFTEAGFVAFNRHYVQSLAAWGIFRDEINPVARSNVCPELAPPGEPSFYAFSYTVPGEGGGFVAAGSGEAREGAGSYAERIVRLGERSAAAMRDKAHLVLAIIEERMAALGYGWPEATATQLYTVYPIHACLADEFVARGAAAGGLTWHFARPPVEGLDLEVDARGVGRELVLAQ